MGPENGGSEVEEGVEVFEEGADGAGDERGREVLFRDVAEGGFDEQADWAGEEAGLELEEPGGVGRLAGQQPGFGDVRVEPADEERGGEFDDAADPAGSEVVVGDEQNHGRSV